MRFVSKYYMTFVLYEWFSLFKCILDITDKKQPKKVL